MITLTIPGILLCGCTEQQQTLPQKTITMSAQEYTDDIDFSMGTADGKITLDLDYRTLNEGDTLLIEDTIDNITYTSVTLNVTTISFDVDNYSSMGVNRSEVAFMFTEDLTNSYQIGDDVRITLTIKHFTYANEASQMIIDMEVFAEGWDEESFIALFFIQILPQSTIEKLT
jgi:hypothetical protein